MMKRETAKWPYVEVCSFRGLMIDFARSRGVAIILRGVRSVSDLEYELQMATTNQRAGGVETIFMAPRAEYAFTSAKLIKEIAAGGGDVSGMVTPSVQARLRTKFKRAGGRR
jgi:pantetheine-phosphate adenylyltransferase